MRETLAGTGQGARAAGLDGNPGGGFAAVPQWKAPLKVLKGAVWSTISTFAGTKRCEGQ
jgi:hypothetical protein